jgi:hypothetical protein
LITAQLPAASAGDFRDSPFVGPDRAGEVAEWSADSGMSAASVSRTGSPFS